MSMFHELMMRKKEENFLYHVIHGSLTESPEGVFSGFSTTSYLTLSTIDLSNSFEILLKVKTPSTWGTDSGIIINSNYSNANRFIVQKDSSNKRFQYRIPTYDQSGYVNYYSPTTILEDTYYYIKFVFNGSSLVVSRSTDNTNWEIDVNISRSQGLPSNAYTLGRNANLELQQWGGSIDLNRSYIKIGATKYNLQAVVGYTIVGSPTITDGVVSGFSASNYLTCSGADVISSADNWEIVVRLINGSGSYFIGSNKSYALTISRASGNIFLSSNGSSWDIANAVGLGVALPTDCYIKLKFTGTKYICEYSTDNINWVSVANIDSSLKLSTITYLKIGSWTGSSNYSGSIVLNETYIKVNGKLWFNGQQA